MTIYEEYKKFVKSTNITETDDIYGENLEKDLIHHLLGITEEVGELIAEYTKIAITKKRDHANFMTELGDILWHYQALLNYFKTDFEEVMKYNMNKLKERKK